MLGGPTSGWPSNPCPDCLHKICRLSVRAVRSLVSPLSSSGNNTFLRNVKISVNDQTRGRSGKWIGGGSTHFRAAPKEMKSFWRDEMRIADFAGAVKEHENVVAVEQWFLFRLRLVTSHIATNLFVQLVCKV